MKSTDNHESNASFADAQPDCGRSTQGAKILHLLISARGEWVPLPAIFELGIAKYNAQIFELRRLGCRIKNKTQEVNGQRRSWFRRETGLARSSAAATSPVATPAVEPVAESLPRFSGGGRP